MPLLDYAVNPQAPASLVKPKIYGVAGIFNVKGGIWGEYAEKLPAHQAHEAAFARFNKIESQLEQAHVSRGLGDNWASMDRDSKEGLVRATSTISAISEEANKCKQEIADWSKNFLKDFNEKMDARKTRILMGIDDPYKNFSMTRFVMHNP